MFIGAQFRNVCTCALFTIAYLNKYEFFSPTITPKNRIETNFLLSVMLCVPNLSATVYFKYILSNCQSGHCSGTTQFKNFRSPRTIHHLKCSLSARSVLFFFSCHFLTLYKFFPSRAQEIKRERGERTHYLLPDYACFPWLRCVIN